MMRRLLVGLVATLIAMAALGGAEAAVNPGVYDLDALGVPRFVNVNYIDLAKISQISKFRSSAGHDYHDDVERCRSMKHYFVAPDATTSIWAPVAGTISKLDDDFVGKQVQIVSDVHPGIVFILFHVNLAQPLAVGDHVDAGQKLGTHVGTATLSDIAVAVHTPTFSYRLISYFETLTDSAFAAYQSRGIQSRGQMSFTKAERDAAPYTCSGEAFTNRPVPPEDEYVDLTGAQRLTVTNPPEVLSLADSPYPLVAAASSGLPVAITTAGPCAAANSRLTLSGVGTCHVYFDQPGNTAYFPARQYHYVITVLAAPQGPRLGSVLSSAQSTAQSYLRVNNTGATPESVNVVLFAPATGDRLGEWNSEAIPAGASAQYAVSTIEAGVGGNFTKPAFYTMAVQTRMSGSIQHVVWTPARRTLSNLSTCDTGAATNPTALTHVHSSLVQADNPSAIVITNTSGTATAVQLGVFDAVSGTRLGTYTSPVVPANGQRSVGIPALESGAAMSPVANRLHYTIRAEGNFAGYLQHLVTNTQTNLTSDMTTVCPMRAQSTNKVATRIGTVYSTADSEKQSFIRLYNTGLQSGSVALTLIDSASGVERGQWTSPAIAPEASQQFSLATIETGAGITGEKPASYVLTIQSQMSAGYLQHVVWNPGGGTLADFSTCDSGVTALPNTLINLHSKLLAAGYPSTVGITSTSTGTLGLALVIGNAATGAQMAGHVISTIPSLGTIQVPVSALEALPQFPAGANMVHYNVRTQLAFPGFFQHLVSNLQAGVTTDMTAVCRIN